VLYFDGIKIELKEDKTFIYKNWTDAVTYWIYGKGKFAYKRNILYLNFENLNDIEKEQLKFIENKDSISIKIENCLKELDGSYELKIKGKDFDGYDLDHIYIDLYEDSICTSQYLINPMLEDTFTLKVSSASTNMYLIFHRMNSQKLEYNILKNKNTQKVYKLSKHENYIDSTKQFKYEFKNGVFRKSLKDENGNKYLLKE